MPNLAELKGSQIVIRLVHPLVEQETEVILTKLVEIEVAGIWIEGRDLAKFLHNATRQAVIPKMPVFFVPFAQVAWITGSADYPSLSEKHFGL